MMLSRAASLPSRASAVGHEEQPWLVNSSTTETGAAVVLVGTEASAVSIGLCAGAPSTRPVSPAVSAISARSRMGSTDPLLFLSNRLVLQAGPPDQGHRRRRLSGFLTSSASHEWVRRGVPLSQIRASQKFGVA